MKVNVHMAIFAPAVLEVEISEETQTVANVRTLKPSPVNSTLYVDGDPADIARLDLKALAETLQAAFLRSAADTVESGVATNTTTGVVPVPVGKKTMLS